MHLISISAALVPQFTIPAKAFDWQHLSVQAGCWILRREEYIHPCGLEAFIFGQGAAASSGSVRDAVQVRIFAMHEMNGEDADTIGFFWRWRVSVRAFIPSGTYFERGKGEG